MAVTPDAKGPAAGVMTRVVPIPPPARGVVWIGALDVRDTRYTFKKPLAPSQSEAFGIVARESLNWPIGMQPATWQNDAETVLRVSWSVQGAAALKLPESALSWEAPISAERLALLRTEHEKCAGDPDRLVAFAHNGDIPVNVGRLSAEDLTDLLYRFQQVGLGLPDDDPRRPAIVGACEWIMLHSALRYWGDVPADAVLGQRPALLKLVRGAARARLGRGRPAESKLRKAVSALWASNLRNAADVLQVLQDQGIPCDESKVGVELARLRRTTDAPLSP